MYIVGIVSVQIEERSCHLLELMMFDSNSAMFDSIEREKDRYGPRSSELLDEVVVCSRSLSTDGIVSRTGTFRAVGVLV